MVSLRTHSFRKKKKGKKLLNGGTTQCLTLVWNGDLDGLHCRRYARLELQIYSFTEVSIFEPFSKAVRLFYDLFTSWTRRQRINKLVRTQWAPVPQGLRFVRKRVYEAEAKKVERGSAVPLIEITIMFVDNRVLWPFTEKIPNIFISLFSKGLNWSSLGVWGVLRAFCFGVQNLAVGSQLV